MTDVTICLGEKETCGRILGADSRLVQFVIERSAHDIESDSYPFVVWVDRIPGPSMPECSRSPSWHVVSCADGSNIEAAPGTEPGCCLCMGRFVE